MCVGAVRVTDICRQFLLKAYLIWAPLLSRFNLENAESALCQGNVTSMLIKWEICMCRCVYVVVVVCIQQPWPQSQDLQNREVRQQRFAHFTELAIMSVQEIVDFAKQLPGFLELTREDQIALLKTSTIEVCHDLSWTVVSWNCSLILLFLEYVTSELNAGTF